MNFLNEINGDHVPKKQLEFLLHSTIHSLLLELPNPSVSSSGNGDSFQDLSKYKYEDEDLRNIVYALGEKFMNTRQDLIDAEAKTNEDTKLNHSTHVNQDELNEEDLDTNLKYQSSPHRNVSQIPVSAYKHYVQEYTDKNIPFIIRRYRSLAWCQKIKRALISNGPTSTNESASTQQTESVDEAKQENVDETKQENIEINDFEIESEVKIEKINNNLQNNQIEKTNLSERLVKVTVTPNGRADALFDQNQLIESGDQNEKIEPIFILPEERIIPFDTFLVHLKEQSKFVKSKSNKKLLHKSNKFYNKTNYYYIQTQNDNLRKDFPDILELLGDLDIGDICFGEDAEAINLWMGTDGSSSSLHRDYYENLYIVVEGTKEFTLYPPFMQPYVYEKQYPVGEWKETSKQEWEIINKETTNVWCSVTPEMPFDQSKFPWFDKVIPFKIKLHPGDLLYLPNMWYHQVSQSTTSSSDYVIAVNYWFSMVFGSTYHYNQMIENISELLISGDLKPEMKEDIESDDNKENE